MDPVAVSGSRCSDSLASSPLSGSSSKTSSTPGTGGCPQCGAVSTPQGIPACAFACPPLKSARGTGVRGASSSPGPSQEDLFRPRPNHEASSATQSPSLPTLTARDWRDGRASATTMERNSRPLNEMLPTLVAEADRQQHPGPNGYPGRLLLPTLMAIRNDDNRPKKPGQNTGLLPTLLHKTNQGSKDRRDGRRGGELLPTLRASENDASANGKGATTEGGIGLLPTLTAMGYGSNQGGAEPVPARLSLARRLSSRGGEPALLNPRWCEVFMGFPEGWTSPFPVDRFQSAASGARGSRGAGMRWSRRVPRRLATSSGWWPRR